MSLSRLTPAFVFCIPAEAASQCFHTHPIGSHRLAPHHPPPQPCLQLEMPQRKFLLQEPWDQHSPLLFPLAPQSACALSALDVLTPSFTKILQSRSYYLRRSRGGSGGTEQMSILAEVTQPDSLASWSVL